MNKIIDLLKNLLARREPSLDETYLAAATDLHDLERRMRELDNSRHLSARLFPIVSYG